MNYDISRSLGLSVDSLTGERLVSALLPASLILSLSISMNIRISVPLYLLFGSKLKNYSFKLIFLFQLKTRGNQEETTTYQCISHFSNKKGCIQSYIKGL